MIILNIKHVLLQENNISKKKKMYLIFYFYLNFK